MPMSRNAPGFVLCRHAISRSSSLTTRSAGDRNATHVDRPNMLGPQMVACSTPGSARNRSSRRSPPRARAAGVSYRPCGSSSRTVSSRSDRNARSVLVNCDRLCNITSAPAASTNAAVTSTPASHRAVLDERATRPAPDAITARALARDARHIGAKPKRSPHSSAVTVVTARTNRSILTWVKAGSDTPLIRTSTGVIQDASTNPPAAPAAASARLSTRSWRTRREARGANGKPHRELTRSIGRTHEQEVGHVDAADQQDEDRSAEQEPHWAARLDEVLARQLRRPQREVGIGGRVCRGDACAKSGELGPCGFDGGSFGQTRDTPRQAAGPVGQAHHAKERRRALDWRPDVDAGAGALRQVAERFRHHADHREDAVLQPDVATDDRRVRAEFLAPGRLAENGDERAVGADGMVHWREGSAEERGGAEDREVVAPDEVRVEPLRAIVAPERQPPRSGPRRDHRQRLRLWRGSPARRGTRAESSRRPPVATAPRRRTAAARPVGTATGAATGR